jgi:hypothetical protein
VNRQIFNNSNPSSSKNTLQYTRIEKGSLFVVVARQDSVFLTFSLILCIHMTQHLTFNLEKVRHFSFKNPGFSELAEH